MDGDDGSNPGQSGVQPGMHRVKLYKLNTQGLWDDKGTGHVAVEWLPVRCFSLRQRIELRGVEVSPLIVCTICAGLLPTRTAGAAFVLWVELRLAVRQFKAPCVSLFRGKVATFKWMRTDSSQRGALRPAICIQSSAVWRSAAVVDENLTLCHVGFHPDVL